MQNPTAYRDGLPPTDDAGSRENHRWLAALAACVLVVWLAGLGLAFWL